MLLSFQYIETCEDWVEMREEACEMAREVKKDEREERYIDLRFPSYNAQHRDLQSENSPA